MKKKPETIENRWDILYKDYPEIYDEFADIPRKPDGMNIIIKKFNLKNKIVADIGSGSGKSTFPLTKYAKYVIGIEPEDSMRRLAIENVKKKGIKNVKFKKGTAEKIPIKKNSVDFVFGITVASFYNKNNIIKFIKEARRIVKKGGYIVTLNVAPKWYGGELAPMILGKSRITKVDTEGIVNKTLIKLGFKYKDFYQVQNYGSVSKAVRTYGFIFGKKAIKYINEHKKTKIKWKLRIHYKKI
jgi:ubiquinone/menaquinone biosynthesis C-methylase UbiE